MIRHSCWDSNLQPFDHESSTLTNKLSQLPWEIIMQLLLARHFPLACVLEQLHQFASCIIDSLIHVFPPPPLVILHPTLCLNNIPPPNCLHLSPHLPLHHHNPRSLSKEEEKSIPGFEHRSNNGTTDNNNPGFSGVGGGGGGVES